MSWASPARVSIWVTSVSFSEKGDQLEGKAWRTLHKGLGVRRKACCSEVLTASCQQTLQDPTALPRGPKRMSLHVRWAEEGGGCSPKEGKAHLWEDGWMSSWSRQRTYGGFVGAGTREGWPWTLEQGDSFVEDKRKHWGLGPYQYIRGDSLQR